jgi:hypothetical protein
MSSQMNATTLDRLVILDRLVKTSRNVPLTVPILKGSRTHQAESGNPVRHGLTPIASAVGSVDTG